MEKPDDLKEIAGLFIRLGFTSFGGPAAHIAMMRREVVQKRQWISEDHFLDLIGATNLIPGPNSTEMAIHIGRERAGLRGLLVAGLCFILPAVLITCIFAWLYKAYGQLPKVQPFLYGITPAIIAVILNAVLPLAKKSLRTVELRLTGMLALTLALLHFNEISILFGAGICALLLHMVRSKTRGSSANTLAPLALIQTPAASLLALSNTNLFLIFLKTGALLYGSGYVLFAFLDAELVSKGLLSRHQLTDAIAAGQFTPGPVFSAATFIGYQVNGFTGAFVSTLGIFLPSFLFVAFLNPLVKRLRDSTLFSAFLDAVNVASVALIAAVCYEMGKGSITDWKTVSIALASLMLVFTFRRMNSAWVILGGSMAGYLLTLF